MKNIHKAKFILISLMIGLMASSFFVYADEIQQFILTKVNYPIIVNNQEYTNSELPVLNYEGNTYVPLKAVGKLLSAEVKWNDELKRVEIGKNNPSRGKKEVKINDIFIEAVVINNIEYISVHDVSEIYYDLNYAFTNDSGSLDNFRFVYDKKKDGEIVERKTLLEIPKEVLTIYNGRTHIQYNYYVNNILPLMKK